MLKTIVPIVFAVDDRYAPFLGVTLRSLLDHADETSYFEVYVLHAGIRDSYRLLLDGYRCERMQIEFITVADRMHRLDGQVPLRDYYTNTTYFRFFIPDLFPQYDKILYLDSDILLTGDVTELWRTDLGDCLIGAAPEEVMALYPVFSDYVEEGLGIPCPEYFNAGVILMNLTAMRKIRLEERFLALQRRFRFEVTQDEDYLNVICHGRVRYFDLGWNKAPLPNPDFDESQLRLIHYKLTLKPWINADIPYADLFWQTAERTPFYTVIREQAAAVTDENRAADEAAFLRLQQTARHYVADENNYRRTREREGGIVLPLPEEPVSSPRSTLSPDRVEVLHRIARLEREERWCEDVEDDPPTVPLRAGEIDYTGERLTTRLSTRLANIVARRWFERRIRQGELVIRQVVGLENYEAVKAGGVIVTCNHFNAFDNYAVYRALRPALGRRNLYKIIREGNYTSYGGLFGYFFRHCNTLPLGSSVSVMSKFMDATHCLLTRGETVLIYPEQGMWWNYRKPRPLQEGAFQLAVKNGVPVLPIFITMEDTDRLAPDGYPIQAYTVHILPAIHPNPALDRRRQVQSMREANYAAWVRVYERVYGIPLRYAGNQEGACCTLF